MTSVTVGQDQEYRITGKEESETVTEGRRAQGFTSVRGYIYFIKLKKDLYETESLYRIQKVSKWVVRRPPELVGVTGADVLPWSLSG